MTTVGPYTLLSKLGEGGMGIVHLARHDATGERVALKVLRPQVVGDDEGRARLAREVSSLERVRSRWVAEIVAADPWGPIPYVATRYVPGLSLHDFVVERGPVRGRDLQWLARCLAEGIAACHAAGVMHRDVKPSNVLMEGRTPVLIDFGLARVADDPKITHAGWLLGTPGYLPPEILRGADATPAADVHSWAATVAYAASGKSPFGTGPSAAIMDRARRGEFELGGVPEPLATVLAGCLSPDPAARPDLDAIITWLRDPGGPLPRATGIATAVLEESASTPSVAVPMGAGQRTPPPPQPSSFGAPAGPAEAVEQPGSDPGLRVRSFVLWLLAGLACGTGLAAFPWVTLVVLLLLVWLLRSVSMAAADLAARRELRGRRWYDGPRLLLGAPWDLIRSVPSTLVLVLWAVGLATAAALLCYAITAPLASALFACGVVLAAMLCLGPGSDHVRGPLGHVVRPLSSFGPRWAAAGVVLLAAIAGLGVALGVHGIDWFPFRDAPISAMR